MLLLRVKVYCSAMLSGCSEIPNNHSVFNFEPVGVSDKLSRLEIPNN